MDHQQPQPRIKVRDLLQFIVRPEPPMESDVAEAGRLPVPQGPVLPGGNGWLIGCFAGWLFTTKAKANYLRDIAYSQDSDAG